MIYPHLDYEIKYWSEGVENVAGVDEAGRGPLAGPVVAGAVIARPDVIEKIKKMPEYRLVRDSKTLSSRQRDAALAFIEEYLLFGVGFSGRETIDEINILQATFLAMKKAVSDLKRKIERDPEVLLVDGPIPIPNTSKKQENIINGDTHVFSISAASIVAKVTRDRMMLKLHEKFPVYGFDKHKGYGTKFHFEMLKKNGPCEAHRNSFRMTPRAEKEKNIQPKMRLHPN